MVRSPRVGHRVRDWALWRLNARGATFLVVAELAAALWTLLSFRHSANSGDDLARGALLLGLAVVYGEASDRIERLRRFLGADGVVSNQYSVVCLAGLLVLPLDLAAVLSMSVYGHTYLRTHRHASARSHRLIFTAAASVLATLVAGTLYHGLDGHLDSPSPAEALLVLVTIAVYTIVNLIVLVTGMTLVSRPDRWRSLLPGRAQVYWENSTLLLGVFAGVMVLDAPWLSPLILILVAVLHRSSLVADLERAAARDPKTALLNSGAWYSLANAHLATCKVRRTTLSLILIDLDRFKDVNDTFGHLAGDKALRSVADTLMSELRDYDAIGRYGGEEFVALLPGVNSGSAGAIAERIRRAIGDAGGGNQPRVTASIGVATSGPSAARTVDDLIRAADLALYRAKDAGRDQVCSAPDLG